MILSEFLYRDAKKLLPAPGSEWYGAFTPSDDGVWSLVQERSAALIYLCKIAKMVI